MICKKCGASIQDNSKFCGVCGEKIEDIIIPVIEDQNIKTESVVEEIPMVVPLIQSEQVQVEPVLEQTAVVEPIVPEIKEDVNSVVEQPLEQTAVVEPVIPEPVANEVITPVIPIQESNILPVQNKEPKKKNNALIFVLLGVLLGAIALGLAYFAFSKSSSGSVRVLEKALSNLEFKGEKSGTIDMKLLLQSDTEDSMNFSATMKYAKQGDDNYNFNLIVNKSMLFDEMNVYASVLDERATLYVNSSLIDMLGMTSSTPSMWLYTTMTEQDLEMQTGTEMDELDDLDLSDIIDKNHFKLISEENELKHYQLVIDNQLINKTKIEAYKNEDLKSFAESLSELAETHYVDFYINNSNELVKISMDLASALEYETIKSAVVSVEFNNLGATQVQIPAEVRNSTMDLETYMATYAIQDDTTIDPSLDQNYTYQY